jgi:hypothetical protein
MRHMAIEDAIWALQEHWADVTARLDAGSREELGRMLDGLDGPDRPHAMARIADLLVEGLPREHPVRRALVDGTLLAPGVLDWPAVTRVLRDLSAATGLRIDAPAPGSVVLADVVNRLLSVAALSEADVRRRGFDPDDPGLIRLGRADGSYQWPAFQFAARGSGPDVVRRINRLLGARTDPLGVADWWLSRNGWLGDAPYRMVGKIPDDLLVQAAQAVVAEA